MAEHTTTPTWQNRLTNLRQLLRRKPRSGLYVPEVDGLRFIAILAVVLFHSHLYFFEDGLIQNFTDVPASRWLEYTIGKGWYGVQLFFIISGFIICLPFALLHLRDGKPISLKKFFLRRFRRIEIPYFIALTMTFLWYIFHHGSDFQELLPRYLAGITYTHNIFYYPDGGLNPILPPGWTLELEIQFYLLAPFISAIYMIRSKALRYGTFLASIIGINLAIPHLHAMFPNNVVFSKVFIIHNLPYFLMGMLIVDLYISSQTFGATRTDQPLLRHYLWDGIGVASAILTLALLSFGWGDIQVFALGLFVLAVMNSYYLRKILSLRYLTLIGGMCYSIYLFHEQILNFSYYYIFPSFIGKGAEFGLNYVGIFTMALWIFILSIPFYLLIEKPFMNSSKKKQNKHTK